MLISIIIPVHNEAKSITGFIEYLNRVFPAGQREIIVVDNGSTDETLSLAQKAGAKIIRMTNASRAAAMNAGARTAAGDVFYFLHADSYPPPGIAAGIINAVTEGCGSGCCRLRFDSSHWLLRFCAWLTRLTVTALRFGDQSLFVSRRVFEAAGWFSENLYIMEDQEIVSRLKQHAPFMVLPQPITTSTRRYQRNGVYRLQALFVVIWTLYYLGVSQARLRRFYKRYVR